MDAVDIDLAIRLHNHEQTIEDIALKTAIHVAERNKEFQEEMRRSFAEQHQQLQKLFHAVGHEEGSLKPQFHKSRSKRFSMFEKHNTTQGVASLDKESTNRHTFHEPNSTTDTVQQAYSIQPTEGQNGSTAASGRKTRCEGAFSQPEITDNISEPQSESGKEEEEQEEDTEICQPASQGRERTSFNTAGTRERSRSVFIKSFAPVKKLPWWRDLDDPNSSYIAYVYALVMNPLVLMSVFLTLSSKLDPPWFAEFNGDWLSWAQIMFDILFGLEVLVRFGTAVNKLSFLLDAFNVIDLIAVIPLLVVRAMEGFSLNSVQGNMAIDIVRALGPVFKVCKVLRRFPTIHLLINAFYSAMQALPVLMYIYLLMGLTAASLLYALEPRSNIDSMQTCLWLTVITMTTTGYGDKIPVTQQGRIVVGILVVVQTLYMALPLGILGQEFTDVWKQRHTLSAINQIRNRMAVLGLGFHDLPRIFQQFGNYEAQLTFSAFKQLCDVLGIKMKEENIRKLFITIDSEDFGAIEATHFAKHVFPDKYLEYEDPEQTAYRMNRSWHERYGLSQIKERLTGNN